MYYHVRITRKSNKSHDEVVLGLTEQQLRDRYLDPYDRGNPFVINGSTILPSDLERIRISKSSESPQDLVARAGAERRSSNVLMIGGPSDEWSAANLAQEVTNDFILGPPGRLKASASPSEPGHKNAPSNKRVFVVHGHDHALKSDLEVFLREVGLDPVVLHRQTDEGRTVIEKIERNADVAYAIILLTPDDLAYPKDEGTKKEAERSIEQRARQNVIFEFGYFAGLLGRSKVCCLYRPGVSLPSDLNGFVYKEVNPSIESIGFSLIKELQAAGLHPQIK